MDSCPTQEKRLNLYKLSLIEFEIYTHEVDPKQINSRMNLLGLFYTLILHRVDRDLRLILLVGKYHLVYELPRSTSNVGKC